MGVLDEVRGGCARVAALATRVRVRRDRLPAYATALPLRGTTAFDTPHVGDTEATLTYAVTLNAINFGSGYFPHLRKLPGMSGYFTVATRLRERFVDGGPLSAAELALVSARDCAAIFGQETDHGPVAELMALFARALEDLGRLLLERYDGRFAALVEAAGHSAERLVVLLTEMAFFRDVTPYRGDPVPFYKRAQLVPADLARMLGGRGLGRFDDLARLTIFADNLVPHVLRVDGILDYDADLGGRIDAGELIEPASEEEVEIRASALHAVELLAEHVRGSERQVTAMELDSLLWQRGQQPAYKARPRHRTRTVFY